MMSWPSLVYRARQCTPPKDQSVAAIAEREGRTPQDVAYDMLIEDGGRDFIFATIVNYANYDLSAVKTMYAEEHVIPGLSDGGAHVAFISDASFPTFLLSYWGRDAKDGRLSIPDLVRRQTKVPAEFAGLTDRGVLAPGMKADINVIDSKSSASSARRWSTICPQVVSVSCRRRAASRRR